MIWEARAGAAGRALPAVTAGCEDNLASWPSVEPAGDYAAASLLAVASAFGAQGLPGG